jgi:predicted aminopeptidase
MRLLNALVCCVALLPAWGCTISRFLTQAAAGQWQLNRRSQPIDELLANPNTSAEIRARLGQLEHVKRYGARYGLLMHKNYRDYIQLDQPYVVWFVNGSHPLAFLPLTFAFPIVGSFPGISWFDEQRALDFKAQLEKGGWDVNLRGVTAFSTGGWFRDPVLSSMFFDHPAQVGYFANTILHESVHATVLVPNQQYFNESLASFVADTMTPPFLAEVYASSPQTLAAYEETRKTSDYIVERLLTTFRELDGVYQSERSDEAKLALKTQIIDRLMAEIPFPVRPNNATLIGFQLYQEGTQEFEELFAACNDQWPPFLEAVRSLHPDHFDEPQTMNIGATVRLLSARHCRPFPKLATHHMRTKQQRQHDAHRRRALAQPTRTLSGKVPSAQ